MVAGDEQKVMKVITYIMIVITVVLFVLTIVMIRRIKIAVACIKVAASAVSSMPSLIFFPLITFISFVALFAYWVIIFTYLWSAGDVVETYREAEEETGSYGISTLYDGTASNSTMQYASLFPSAPPPPPSSQNVTIPCYDDPDCYYSVQFNKTLQARGSAFVFRTRLESFAILHPCKH